MHMKVLQRVQQNREFQQFPNVVVYDNVLEARVRRSETTPKLVSTWAGP